MPSKSRYEPCAEAIEAVKRLEGWLLSPKNGKPVSQLAEETLRGVRCALLEGKNGYLMLAEERLEALQECPEMVGVTDEKIFRQDVEDVLDCMEERVVGKGLER